MGTACRTRRSAASIPVATRAALSAPLIAILAATSRLSGPMCSVRRWMTHCTSGPASSAATMARSVSALADSPISRLFISTASTAATQPSSTPMASDPAPSHTPSPVITVSATPAMANTRPVSAAMSSSRMAGSSGALARRMNADQLLRPRTSLVSCTAVRSEKLSRPIAMTSTTNATTGELMCSGLMIFGCPRRPRTPRPR